jgi:hypothetical protein
LIASISTKHVSNDKLPSVGEVSRLGQKKRRSVSRRSGYGEERKMTTGLAARSALGRLFLTPLPTSLLGFVLGIALVSVWAARSAPPAQAAVEEWSGESWVPHVQYWSIQVKPIGVIAGSTNNWSSHYSASISAWNAQFVNDPFIAVSSGSPALIHVLQAGSFDEALLDAWMEDDGFEVQNTCNGAYDESWNWGGILIYFGDDLDGDYGHHKVCIFTANIPNASSGGIHYRQLTIMHELGHGLSLGDDADGSSNCLMRSGWSMQPICTGEVNHVKSHYVRN